MDERGSMGPKSPDCEWFEWVCSGCVESPPPRQSAAPLLYAKGQVAHDEKEEIKENYRGRVHAREKVRRGGSGVSRPHVYQLRSTVGPASLA